MKNLFKIFTIILFCISEINSQDLLFRRWTGGDNYDPPGQYPVNRFASDFGPRHYGTDNYDWHGGLDYNDSGNSGDDEHDLVLGVEIGDVDGDMRANGAKYVVIGGNHNFNYVHLFRSGTITATTSIPSGACELRIPDFPDNGNNAWAIIFKISGTVSAITNMQAQPGQNVTVTSPNYNNGQPIIAYNHIDATYPMVGPVGGSGGYGPHLHLGMTVNFQDSPWSDNIAKNPLQFVNHPSPTYINDILLQDDQTKGIEIIYPGDYENTIQARIAMDGQSGGDNYSVIMDVDKVEFKIKKSSSSLNYEAITGPNFDRIELGGRLDGTRMPNGMINDDVVTDGYIHVGSWGRTGIYPYAYNAQPYDDFYFNDFVTRIHKDDVMGSIAPTQIANCPDYSRYGDGAYLLKIVSTNINNVATEGPKTNNQLDPIEFTLDNFKPYIQSVSIRTIQSNTQFYNENWICSNNQCVSFSNNDMTTSLTATDCASGMLITVMTSEEMENLTLSIPAYNISNKQPESATEGMTFVFRIESSEITDLTQEVILHFSGTDKNNNQVISFSPTYEQSCVSVPTRISNTNWSDPNTPDLTYGDDQIHRFKFSCANPGQGGLINGLLADYDGTEVLLEQEEIILTTNLIHPTFNHDCKDGAIDLKINGGFTPYEVKWYKVIGNGQNHEIKKAISQTGNDGNEDLSELEPGTFMVEVSDALCGIVSESFVLNNCGCIVVEKSYQKNVSKCGNNLNTGTPYEVCDGELRIDVKGTEHYEIEWSNGSHELSISNLCTGTYTVTVTIDGCDPIIESYEICCCNNETLVDDHFPMCEVSFKISIVNAEIKHPSQSGASDGAINLIVEGGNGANYNWTGSNGFTANTEDISGLGVGTYCVTITNDCGAFVSGCYILYDCSGLDLHSGNDNLLYGCNCTLGNIGKIDFEVSGGIAPYSFNWSSGYSTVSNENHAKIKNLFPGTYCVTITDKRGCKKTDCQSISSGNINYVPQTGPPCGYSVWCNSSLINFFPEEEECIFDDPSDCRWQTCYCKATGLPSGPRLFFDYPSFIIDIETCSLWGECPDPNSSSEVLLEYGKSYKDYDWICQEEFVYDLNGTGCSGWLKYDCVCWEQYYCYFEDYNITVNIPLEKVSDDLCPFEERVSKVDKKIIKLPIDYYIDGLVFNDSSLILKNIDSFKNTTFSLINNNSNISNEDFLDKIRNSKLNIPIKESNNSKNSYFTTGINYYLTPNPFESSITLELEKAISKRVEVNIFNVIGENVYSKNYEKITQNIFNIDLNYLTSGIYYVKLNIEGQDSQFLKIIKAH